MYLIDEYVVHTTGGICRVAEIAPLAIPGADKNALYYYLMPIRENGSKVFVPVNNESAIRKVCTEEEAWNLIDEIPCIEELIVENDKMREVSYKAIIKSCDLRQLVSIIKSLMTRKREREEAGKRSTATDDKYLKIAEENLFSELAFAIGRNKLEMRDIIAERIGTLSLT